MSKTEQLTMRTFKTAWFSKAAKKASIADTELCEAIRQVMQGQADDLGGGVFKKRLNNNLRRSIILAKGGRYMSTCLPRRIGKILMMTSWRAFANLPKSMLD